MHELMKFQKMWGKSYVTSFWKSPIDACALIRNEILAYYSTEIQLPTNITSWTRGNDIIHYRKQRVFGKRLGNSNF